MSKREEIRVGKDSGRVKVFARVRPLSKEEISKKTGCAVEVSEESRQINVYDSRKKFEKMYQFDHVFSSSQTNEKICEQLSKPIVNSALEGFNGTLMAYGQTGTGKTHTLMASDGLTQDIINKVFERTHSDVNHEFKVTASYLQIYQEKIHDLLNINTKIELNIRESPKVGIYVENLTEYVVRSPAEALSLIAFGRRRLVFAETKMNRTSSRSHSVFQMTIEKAPKKEKSIHEQAAMKEAKKVKSGQDENDEGVVQMMGLGNDVVVRGKIHLCDLAGSERVKKTHAAGDRLSEAQCINSSLLELGNVIQALADNRKTHVPFRNSVLTRLLQESLGGNCKTSLMVCVSPSIRDVSETKSTLNFGSRAMKVTNTAYVNMEVDFKRLSDSLLLKLEQKELELQQLRKERNSFSVVQTNDLLSKVDVISDESKKVIQSLKLLHENQVTGLQDEISELEKNISCKDEKIGKLQSELDSFRESRSKENEFAKALLLSELVSLEILAAKESNELIKKRTHNNSIDQEQLVVDLLEHCEYLVKYSSCFIKSEPLSTSGSGRSYSGSDSLVVANKLPADLMKFEDEDHEISLPSVHHNFDMSTLESNLVSTKSKIDKLLNAGTSNGVNHSSQDENPGSISPITDLCKVMIDKAYLAGHVVLENHTLKKKLARLSNEEKTHQSPIELNYAEVISEKLKRITVDHADVEERCSGFENALSKIEDILSSQKTDKDVESIIRLNGSSERNFNSKIKNDYSKPKNKLNRQNTFTLRKDVETQTCFNLVNSFLDDQENEEANISSKTVSAGKLKNKNVKDSLHDRIKLEGLEFIKTLDTNRVSKATDMKTRTNGLPDFKIEDFVQLRSKTSSDKHTYINCRSEDSKEKDRESQELSSLEISFFEEDASMNNLISGAADMASAIDEYIKLDSEINNVRSEIKRNSSKSLSLVRKNRKETNDREVCLESSGLGLLCNSNISAGNTTDESIDDSKLFVVRKFRNMCLTDDNDKTDNPDGSKLKVPGIEPIKPSDSLTFEAENNHTHIQGSQKVEINALIAKLALLEQENQDLTNRLDQIEANNLKRDSEMRNTVYLNDPYVSKIFRPPSKAYSQHPIFLDNTFASFSLPIIPQVLPCCSNFQFEQNGLFSNVARQGCWHGDVCYPMWNLQRVNNNNHIHRNFKEKDYFEKLEGGFVRDNGRIDQPQTTYKLPVNEINSSCHGLEWFLEPERSNSSAIEIQQEFSLNNEITVQQKLNPVPYSIKCITDDVNQLEKENKEIMSNKSSEFLQHQAVAEPTCIGEKTRIDVKDAFDDTENNDAMEKACDIGKINDELPNSVLDCHAPEEAATTYLIHVPKDGVNGSDELDSDVELDRKLDVYNQRSEETICEAKAKDSKTDLGKTLIDNGIEERRKIAQSKKRYMLSDIVISENASLEVKIGSNSDECLYGDSFVSPLVKKDPFCFCDDDADIELNGGNESSSQLDLKCLDLDLDNPKEDVVVRKSWSLSDWLWKKHPKPNQIEEISVVIQ